MPSARSTATYGTRSESATASTAAGSTSPGSSTDCSRAPRSFSTRAGSSRWPYISRFTRPLGQTAERGQRQGGQGRGQRGGDGVGEVQHHGQQTHQPGVAGHQHGEHDAVDQRPVDQALDVEELVATQRDRQPDHERQAGQTDRTAGQQLAAGDQFREDPADQPEAHRHGTAEGQQAQPGAKRRRGGPVADHTGDDPGQLRDGEHRRTAHRDQGEAARSSSAPRGPPRPPTARGPRPDRRTPRSGPGGGRDGARDGPGSAAGPSPPCRPTPPGTPRWWTGGTARASVRRSRGPARATRRPRPGCCRTDRPRRPATPTSPAPRDDERRAPGPVRRGPARRSGCPSRRAAGPAAPAAAW